MRDTLDLVDALFSPLGVWLAVTFLMGVAVQLVGLVGLVAAIGRRTADMVRTARAARRARGADDDGEWAVVSPPPGP
ncbi:hypothetical protein [Streptomyces niveus]|uniref:hypothetical protein n=1 Tax=Streptomyces niveus TaxID=193462 RepID=UPI0036C2E347